MGSSKFTRMRACETSGIHLRHRIFLSGPYPTMSTLTEVVLISRTVYLLANDGLAWGS
jgi:hypothetical protein